MATVHSGTWAWVRGALTAATLAGTLTSVACGGDGAGTVHERGQAGRANAGAEQAGAAVALAPEEAGVQVARAAYAATARDLPKYRRVERMGADFRDTAAVRVTGFYDGSELRKIEIGYDDGEDRVKEELYFAGGQLLFRYRAVGRPAKGAAAAAPGREDRYYFASGRLVRWVDAEGRRVPASYASFPVAERETLEGVKPVLAALGGPARTFDAYEAGSALLRTDHARSLELKALRLDDEDLAQALLYGDPIDLEELPDGRKQPLLVRLWRVDLETSCGPAGHMICAHRYLLAVRDPGEGGDAAVYDLGELGTIEELEWLPPHGDRPVLQLTALNYPAHVFEYWPGVDRQRGTFVLTIGSDSLTIRRARPARR